ncbi:MAG: tetratricopeptide repeat protein [Deltaproteobacteria bacterium]|nr:MAG: tetratricopeptide repeat protein [Deltaproteobacteria bacterium]
MASASPPSSRWLFGPVPDLLLGCGVGYVIVFAILAVAGPEVRRIAPIGLLPLVALVTGTPHYGATLLRVYERREDRRAYAFFSVYATAAVWLTFVGGLYHAALGSWFVTLYLTWSPWHYTGQNYGLALMFLRRRGIRVTPTAKRHLYASFFSCFLITVIAIHGSAPSAAYAPASTEATVFQFISLGIPAPIAGPLLVLALAVYLYTTVVAGMLLRREAAFRDLLPSAVLVLTQSLWFAIPVLTRATQVLEHVEPLSVRYADYAFLWVAYAHSVQYLWVTTYYATTSKASTSRAGYLVKTLLAGAAIWVVPALVFAPGALGRVPYDAGLLLLVASAVNLHHFILDGAIWKLRDGRIARVLIRSAGASGAVEPALPPRFPWRSRAIFAVGAACVAISVFGTLESEFGVRRAVESADVSRLGTAARRLAWIGRDDPEVQLQLGVLAAREGRPETGLRALERSLALQPTSRAWVAIGSIHASAHRHEQALAAYESALALEPDDLAALYGSGLAWLELGERERARKALRRALAIAPEDSEVRPSLRRALRASRRPALRARREDEIGAR